VLTKFFDTHTLRPLDFLGSPFTLKFDPTAMYACNNS
jgi:hypothetical protein